MIRHSELMAACGQAYDAALIGDGWAAALDALSKAAGAGGVVIMHNRNRRLASFLASKAVEAPTTLYLAGKAPPNSRQTKVRHDFEPGFRIDQDDYQIPEMRRDPFYEDYLRPLGLYWHANARLRMEGGDEIAVSFKRERQRGPYDAADKIILDQMLDHLRTCARIAASVFDAETRGTVRALHQSGRPVLEFDAWGRVRRTHGDIAAASDGAAGPLAVIGVRAITADKADQAKLEAAIQRAVRPPWRQAPVLLRDPRGRRHVLQVVPVRGRARDVFLATSAVGVLIGQPERVAVIVDRDLVIGLFGLTAREAEIACRLCEGRSIAEIAMALGVVVDTVRFHLKSIFEKTGTRRQAEIVGLLAQLGR